METNVQIIQTDLLANSVNEFLENSKLSLRQIAKKWNVTAPLLSQVRQSKKQVSLNLGLRILNNCGASTEDQRQWMESELQKQNSEYLRLIGDMELGHEIKVLEKDAKEYLKSDINVLNIFLDISSQEEHGLIKSSIIKFYGLNGVEVCQKLLSLGLIRIENNRYFITEVGSTHYFDKVASLELTGVLLKDQREHRLDKTKMTIMIEDVPAEYELELAEAYAKQVEILKKIKSQKPKSRLDGGKRIYFQISMGEIASPQKQLF